MNNIKKGQVVITTAGRDKGNPFIVIDYEEPFLYIADGNKRRLDNPKKKKERHIQLTNYVDLELNEILETQSRVTNADIRHSLDEFKSKALEEL